MSEDVGAIPVEIKKLCKTPFIAGAVALDKTIRISYKVNRDCFVFEHPSKLKNNISDLHQACSTKKDYSLERPKIMASLGLSGILDEVKTFMGPDQFEHELVRLSVFTNKHESPVWRNKGEHCATLLVLLPGFRGGDLVVKNNDGLELFHEWHNNDLNWVAIRRGYEYQLEKVSKGTCVMLTYHIFAARAPKTMKKVSPVLPEFLAKLHTRVERKEVFGFPCENLYHKALLETCSPECLAKMLRGQDAVLYSAAKAAKLTVELVKIWESSGDDEGEKDIYIDRAFKGFEVSGYRYNRKDDIHRIEDMINAGKCPREVERDDNIVWGPGKHQWLTGAVHPYDDVDEEGGAVTGITSVHCAAAILVTVSGATVTRTKTKMKRTRQADQESEPVEKKAKSEESSKE
ncbi:hypothetical protein SELMODRAFT_410723 [Selaginella moellendorffii]|uniref:Fe2OG dioxygenase domain-containing protein n=1 Tax=Selaginella moellendorffii TaxID=88036 RepID=D8RFN7_SELML|nr:hypothetical protein SELMODRAFT_410723 [Selaginella moellendorffii]